MSAERALVLARVRAALRDVAPGEPLAWSPESDGDPAVAYARFDAADVRSLAALFAQRCAEYRAHVVRCGASAQEIKAAVWEACRRARARTLAVAPGLDAGWIPAEVQALVDDPPLDLARLDAVDGAISACALAIAQTGTIVLDAGPGQGRRALTLIPDLHVCVVAGEQIVAGVPEAVRRMAAAVGEDRAPLTLISGPSATSDIELRRVEGVHGPRRLEVILAG